MNTHAPCLGACWNANTDVQVLGCARLALTYITKYTTKAEPVARHTASDLIRLAADRLRSGDAQDPWR